MSSDAPMMIMAAVIVVAGLFSIIGALRRTANRPAPGADGGGDGGPIFGSPREGHDGDGDGDGGGDGGGD
jgi:hypothetical protein